MLRVLLFGNVKLFSFWISSSFQLLTELPVELRDSKALAKRMANGQEFIVNVNKSLISKYNNGMNQLGIELKSLHNGRPLSFKMRQIQFFMLRILVILTAFSSYPLMSFVISLLQFIILPYSLFISIAYGIVTAIMAFTGHILFFPILKYFVDLLCPMHLNLYISISPTFLIIFLIIDEIICAFCLIQTPKGKTKKISLNRVWQSVCYGFLNCKTYYLVLIPLLLGQSIPLTVWIIDAVLGLSGKICKRINSIHWELMFYHIHRMGHIPNIYPDAHKFHHYLHDTTAFDAHLIGSGAPEECFLIFIEFVIAVFICGGVPPSLSYYALTLTWLNKSLHSRAIKPQHDAGNFHADHHVKPNLNFGMAYPLEMAMQTTSNREHAFNGYKIKRVELDNVIRLQFTPCICT